MKNRPPAAGEPPARPKGFSAAIISWFVFPGLGQMALGRKGRGKVWAVVFTVVLLMAGWPLVAALSALYGAATSLGELPHDMADRMWPVVAWGLTAFAVWLACGIDAWVLGSKPDVGAAAQDSSPPG